MSENSSAPLVLILCTGNSCRSQMAEAFLRQAAGDTLRVASAGSKPSGYVHPLSIEVMKEVGIDLSDARSKSLEEFLDQDVETVITVCGNADEACPAFPGQVRRYHWGFDDPAHASGDKEGQMHIFRDVRDQIERVFSAYGLGRKDAVKQA
ncbi:MAG: arsenate reductase ArsC [Verrucomicrobiae bacterium]|nr:arsenate reductase ArsC [Verrucomicrobiae bacterium]